MRPAQLLILLTFSTWACAQSAPRSEVQDVYADSYSLYTDLHQNPELSAHETHTAEKLGARLRSLGYDVTEHVGGTGVVAVLKNGMGPTVMAAHRARRAPGGRKNRITLCQQSSYQG